MIELLFPRKVKIAAQFDQIMRFANELAKTNPAGLIDLVRLLLRPLQSELLLSAIESPIHGARQEMDPGRLFVPDLRYRLPMPADSPELDSSKFLVHLDRDPVLPCPWHRGRYTDALASIGQGKVLGDWKQDSRNHFVTVWLPWGIAFVTGGNHSIAAGIVGGEGAIRPREVYDMSALLDLVCCDGRQYRSLQNGKFLAAVHDAKIAALFEVGRLIRQSCVIPMTVQ